MDAGIQQLDTWLATAPLDDIQLTMQSLIDKEMWQVLGEHLVKVYDGRRGTNKLAIKLDFTRRMVKMADNPTHHMLVAVIVYLECSERHQRQLVEKFVSSTKVVALLAATDFELLSRLLMLWRILQKQKALPPYERLPALAVVANMPCAFSLGNILITKYVCTLEFYPLEVFDSFRGMLLGTSAQAEAEESSPVYESIPVYATTDMSMYDMAPPVEYEPQPQYGGGATSTMYSSVFGDNVAMDDAAPSSAHLDLFDYATDHQLHMPVDLDIGENNGENETKDGELDEHVSAPDGTVMSSSFLLDAIHETSGTEEPRGPVVVVENQTQHLPSADGLSSTFLLDAIRETQTPTTTIVTLPLSPVAATALLPPPQTFVPQTIVSEVAVTPIQMSMTPPPMLIPTPVTGPLSQFMDSEPVARTTPILRPEAVSAFSPTKVRKDKKRATTPLQLLRTATTPDFARMTLSSPSPSPSLKRSTSDSAVKAPSKKVKNKNNNIKTSKHKIVKQCASDDSVNDAEAYLLSLLTGSM